MNEEVKVILDYLKDDEWDYYPSDGVPYKVFLMEERDKLLDYVTNLQEENEKLRKLCESNHKYGSDMEGKYVVAQTKLDTVAQYLLDHSLNFNDEIETDLYVEEVKDLYHYIKTGDWNRDKGDPCE